MDAEWEGTLGDSPEDGTPTPDWVSEWRGAPIDDARSAAEDFAGYAFNAHDMWECADHGYTVFVRRVGDAEWRGFRVVVEPVPSFTASPLDNGNRSGK